MNGIISDIPSATLTKAFTTPFENAVATARTCYSSKIIYDAEISKNEQKITLRDKIAKSTYTAGHHTTLQHAHFQFAIKNISRHALWSFFHQHPFYNSEQVSQRYVEVKRDKYIIPKINSEKLLHTYVQTVQMQHEAYLSLIDLLHDAVQDAYFECFKGRQKNKDDKRWQGAIKKRCQEVARYILPIGTHAHLYHTISGLTLHRYNRLAQSGDCPYEQALLIKSMVDEVNKFDPLFFNTIEDVIPLESTLEHKITASLNIKKDINSQNAAKMAKEFDDALEGKCAKLYSYTNNSSKVLAMAIRNHLNISKDLLPDEKAIMMLLDPTKNHYLGESLNLLSLSKVSSSLDMVNFGFLKKMSHAADCQAQRHRMIPSVKPSFASTINLLTPDYITPKIFFNEKAKAAKDLYDETQEKTLQAVRKLYENGQSVETVQYLITNAHPIRYQDSGSIMDHWHKWTSRLCYNAQEEIWHVTMDEVSDINKLEPMIGKYIMPPCTKRKLAKYSPVCPEGDRFCGERVWELPVSKLKRLL